MTDDTSVAPWSVDEVRNINRWQATPWVHPYTCHRCRDADPGGAEHKLVATVDGWTCPTCDYRQNWCQACMLDEPWPNPFRSPPDRNEET